MSQTDAVANPVRRPGHELHTDDIKIDQKPVIESREDLEREVVVASNGLSKDYLAALAMAEEPITIRIERSGEKNPDRVIPCWVNGKGAEVLTDGGWLALGHLPVGVPVTTKRKYAEVLANSKINTVNTRSGTMQDDEPRNDIERFTSQRAPFSVIEDKNPLGHEWLSRLIRTN